MLFEYRCQSYVIHVIHICSLHSVLVSIWNVIADSDLYVVQLFWLCCNYFESYKPWRSICLDCFKTNIICMLLARYYLWLFHTEQAHRSYALFPPLYKTLVFSLSIEFEPRSCISFNSFNPHCKTVELPKRPLRLISSLIEV
jgi:hypothetical protein